MSYSMFYSSDLTRRSMQNFLFYMQFVSNNDDVTDTTPTNLLILTCKFVTSSYNHVWKSTSACNHAQRKGSALLLGSPHALCYCWELYTHYVAGILFTKKEVEDFRSTVKLKPTIFLCVFGFGSGWVAPDM